MNKKQILIVEDEIIIATEIEYKIKSFGYTSLGIANSEEKINEVLKNVLPDLILMDINLNLDIDGIAIVEKIQKNNNIPIIYLTSYADQSTLKRAKNTNPYGYLLKPYEDDDLRIALEMALAKADVEIKLIESEERYRTLYNGIPIGMYRSNPEGQLIMANLAVAKLLGYSSIEELYELDLNDAYQKQQLYRADFIRLMEKSHQVKELEYKWIRPDESVVYLQENSNAVRDIEGKIIYYEGTLQDITERKIAETDLKSHQEHIELINKILRHDLTNNLTVINSAIRMYRSSKERHMLDEAVLNIKKGFHLIDRMRELELYISTHDNLTIYSVAKVFYVIMKNYPTVEFNITGSSKVMADDAIYSIFDNIISNAIKHGGTERIDVRLREKKGYVRIEINDFGRGISSKIRDKIFDERFTYGKSGGSGLGLYIVKKNIDRYEGQVEVMENEPRGTRFVIELRAI